MDTQLQYLHSLWLGYVQPEGLVVTAGALASAQLAPRPSVRDEQERLRELVDQATRNPALAVPEAPSRDRKTRHRIGGERRAAIRDLRPVLFDILRWRRSDLAGESAADPLPDSLAVPLPDYGDVLRPTWAVRDPSDPSRWLLLVQVERGALDDANPGDKRGWCASPQARFNRLLRETGVPIGLLFNGTDLRLVYAPAGESTGHLTFPIDAMCTTDGRPVLGALCMLLDDVALFAGAPDRRLPHILAESRKYQSEVTTRLANQVLFALGELVRGFQAAGERGSLELRAALRDQKDDVYAGLLTTLLRLVFLLYAEDQGLMSRSERYARFYSVVGLTQQLRDDHAAFPDSMDQRTGAWARLLALFRLVHAGGRHGDLDIPARGGDLFDPDHHPFLEGRSEPWQQGEVIEVPPVSDGVILRVLQALLILDGERLSYRALDVEQLGSVYESMMGFSVVVAEARTVSVGAAHVPVDLDALLAAAPGERLKLLKDGPGLKLDGRPAAQVKEAKTAEELIAALARRLSPLTPGVVPPGGLLLVPTDERRRSGSHYTPRSLTEPIVETTLGPVLEALGEAPRAEALLSLKVCDPAMGSGAFLVATCRALARRVVAAWDHHKEGPGFADAEDRLVHASRLVAERCLYGVDRNPLAVELAKLSLWLVTFARDLPFTFVDHALRHGDSVVGLTPAQIRGFDWKRGGGGAAGPLQLFGYERQSLLPAHVLGPAVERARDLRRQIHALGDGHHAEKRDLLRQVDAALARVRLYGDALVAAFFGGSNDKAREQRRAELEAWIARGDGDQGAWAGVMGAVADLRAGERGIPPFHWEVEFPEVFDRQNPGFDAFVGNPPFAGKNTIIAGNQDGYLPWLQTLHEGAHGNADLVAHFFRRAFLKLRSGGTFGLIATNTIAQGDTRSTGLSWLRQQGGMIYEARRRFKWPAGAAVVVSVVHVRKGEGAGPARLDGREVDRITAYLFHMGPDGDPETLAANAGSSFQGSIVLGMGFTFDDTSEKATPLAEMRRLIAKDPRNQERIFPYIGGEEVNGSPTQAHHRYVIDFGQMSEEEARGWPDLMRIVEEKVKAEKLAKKDKGSNEKWWQFIRPRPELREAIAGLDRVLAVNCGATPHMAFALLPGGMVFANTLAIFPLWTHAAFATLQSRPHETWARFFASSMKDDLRYTPSTCFETFPFPPAWDAAAGPLEDAGRSYYAHRAALMVAHGEGLTATYNRFHDPDETDPGIVTLRALHDAMDRAVLDAYGWKDLRPTCAFLLDYEEGEEPGTKRKRPWRYRWPDDVRDEVLSRLLALNAERAAAERRTQTPKRGRQT